MSEFANVTVVKAANVYFGGQVTSRTVKFSDGSTKTLGIMMPGDYEFNTSEKELMEILAGEVQIQLPGQGDWRTVGAGDSFEVAGQSSFKIKVTALADYCCSYLG
jgi:purine/pyrimidine-nucleoside phosphorylase